jgi:hypothetical protein
MTASPVRVLVPAGMLGAGFTAESIGRGIALGADVIAVDGGSTDSGPAYLATASAKTPAEAIAADLRLMLTAGDMHAGQQHIPLTELVLQPSEH